MKKQADVKFKRRRMGVTNYKKRLALVKSGMDRIAVRKSNRRILGQIIRYSEKGDVIMASADSGELKKGYKWPSRSNRTTAYLTGLLLAKKAKDKANELTLDIGLSSPVKNSIPFVFAKGCVDGGLKVLGKFEVEEKDYDASRVMRYAEALGKQNKSAKHFAAYSKEGTKVENLETLFKEVKEKIMSG